MSPLGILPRPFKPSLAENTDVGWCGARTIDAAEIFAKMLECYATRAAKLLLRNHSRIKTSMCRFESKRGFVLRSTCVAASEYQPTLDPVRHQCEDFHHLFKTSAEPHAH
jgi:hypothetical protein